MGLQRLAADRYRGVPFITIAPPASLGIGSMIRWMRPTVNAMEFLVEQGRQSARRALEGASLCTKLKSVAS